MSSTTTAVTTATLTTLQALEPPKDAEGTYGTFKFAEPELSVSADDRSMFAVPATKAWETACMPIHDYRTSSLPHKGTLTGLDYAGFSVVLHETQLHEEEWLDETTIKEKYFPEVEELVKELTGCKTVVCNNATFRRRLAKNQEDPHFYRKRDAPDSMDNMLKEGKAAINGPLSMSALQIAERSSASCLSHTHRHHYANYSC